MNKTIVITGASSGIGRATAELFASKGWNVAATMRNIADGEALAALDTVNVYQLDVTDKESVCAARDQIIHDFDEVDVIVNNAGYGVMGIFEAASETQIKKQFATNLFGVMTVTKAFLPHYRSKGSGMYVNVSSVGGLTTYPVFSLYHSSKWALEGFSESLSYELGELGIQVKMIEPGGTQTDFLSRSLVTVEDTDLKDYQETLDKFNRFVDQMATPERMRPASDVAETIYEAATDEKQRFRYIVGVENEERILVRHQTGVEESIAQTRELIFSDQQSPALK